MLNFLLCQIREWKSNQILRKNIANIVSILNPNVIASKVSTKKKWNQFLWIFHADVHVPFERCAYYIKLSSQTNFYETLKNGFS